MFDKPLGGTELMYNELMKRIGSKYDHLSIFNYIGQADFNKTTVYWNQLSYDQQAVQWLSNPNDVEMIDHFVFISVDPAMGAFSSWYLNKAHTF